MREVRCPRCKGKGTVALHGIAITADEWNGPDWGPEEQENYLSGAYDTECTLCYGRGSLTEDALEERLEMEHEARMGY